LAEVARPHGVRGEVRLRLFNQDSDALLELDEVLVRLPDGQEHEVSVDSARRANDVVLMKLFSIDDRDRAEEVRGALICAKRSDFPALESGEFYACDIEGAEAWLEGVHFGTVTELRTYPSVSVFVIKPISGGADLEIPLVEAFVSKVDVEARKVTLERIDGLLEIG
jgi:16S rRNA processing protein RimM